MDNVRDLLGEIGQQRQQLEQAVSYALDLAQQQHLMAEVAVNKTTGIAVSTRYGQVENVEFNSDGALGITVYHQQRKGSASSTDLRQEAIAATVQAAADIARYTSADPYAGLPERQWLALEIDDLDLLHPAPLNVEQAIDWAALAEQAALQADKRITHTEGGNFSSHYGIKVFGNSLGMLQSYCTSRHGLSACVIAQQQESMERDYAYTISRQLSALTPAAQVGQQCAQRVLRRLSPQKLTTRQAPVIFAAEVAGAFWGHLVSAISGSNVYRQSTFLLDKLGKAILPDWLTISEQPHLLRGLASCPFDSEGVKTHQRNIVEQGVLQTWLLNNYSARKLNLTPTGHAGGIHNWLVTHQALSLPALLKQMGKGLLVTELMGQGVSTVTGDYSRGAAGFWVENGEIQYPVSEITIAGNLTSMMQDIVAIADDVEQRSTIQSGSILVANMQIAGQ